MNDMTRERACHLFGALSHPVRLRITELLCSGEKTVNEISAALPLSQSGTSQHLAILTRAGVLKVEPRGATRIYRVRGPRIARILSLIEEFCTVHGLYGAADEIDAEAISPFSGEEHADGSPNAARPQQYEIDKQEGDHADR